MNDVIMPILQQYLFVIGSFQGLLLAALLLFDANNTNASRILGIWCLCFALSFLAAFIVIDNQLNVFSFLIGWSFFLPASYGALLYLYCRHAIVERPLSAIDFIHFLPLLICWLLNIDILMAPADEKLTLVINGPTHSLAFVLSQFILFVQAFVYIYFSARLINQHQNKAKHTLSSFNPSIFKWLWMLLILNLVIWTLKVLSQISQEVSFLSSVGSFLIVVLIYSIAMVQWRDPKLFKVEQLTDSPVVMSQNTQTDKHLKPVAGNSVGSLSQEIRLSLLKDVKQLMDEQKLYLENHLTLSSLAEAIGISTHHLSEVLNQEVGKNFYQFVNEYRIHFICEKIKSNPSDKILDLAFSAGFSSKSTFNAVFKQIAGVTPSQYRKNKATK